MDTSQSRLIGAGLFFLFIFLSGFWLNRSGKPYSAVIFNIHKLIGLAAGFFLAIAVYQIHQVDPLGAVEIAAIVITGLFFAVIVAAGGLVSASKTIPPTILRLHQILPYLAVLTTATTLYLLAGPE